MSIVVGYHGTSAEAAARILREGFTLSSNKFDWLGDGIYFFQEAERRAHSWSRELFGDDAAVLRAEIDLRDCMDLLDREWFHLLTTAHDAVVQQHRLAKLRLPKQEGLAHGMDRAVINLAVGMLASQGTIIRSVRSPFAEGRPAFPGSALMDLAHIQIAVRDPSVIGTLEVCGG